MAGINNEIEIVFDKKELDDLKETASRFCEVVDKLCGIAEESEEEREVEKLLDDILLRYEHNIDNEKQNQSNTQNNRYKFKAGIVVEDTDGSVRLGKENRIVKYIHSEKELDELVKIMRNVMHSFGGL